MSTLYGWKRHHRKTESYTHYYGYVHSTNIYARDQVATKRYYSGVSINQNTGKAYGTGSSVTISQVESQNLSLVGWYNIYGLDDRYEKVVTHTPGAPGWYYSDYYRIGSETRTRTVAGNYIDTVTSTNRTAYPDNGVSGAYWYVYSGILNRVPVISGEDLDLGSKTADFVIPYVITDEDGDAVTVTIRVDGVTKHTIQSITLGRSYSFQVKISDYSLGTHRVEIIADDGDTTSKRTYTFIRSNTAPLISGEDEDLGERSTAFTIPYTITDADGDSVSATVILDGKPIQSINDAQGQEQKITITDEMLAGLTIGRSYTISIKADDSKGGIAYRRYTFTKTNRPPIISGSDTDWGELGDPKRLILSITDVEMDQITYKILLDGKVVREAQEAEDNVNILYDIPPERWLPLDYGSHVLEIRAWDEFSVNTPSVRRITFTRIPSGLEVFVKINEFDIKPTKLIAVPHGTFAEDAEITVMVCNNYLDANPTWEDASAMSRIARAYAFENDTKTAGKWAIGIHITIQNGEGGAPSVLRGLKGGYE